MEQLATLNDRPRAMRDPAEVAGRLAERYAPHVKPLNEYVDRLRTLDRGEAPYFDPLSGGVEARALFLLEKPGPMAAGSGFISRNNDDPTAEATWRFQREAGLTYGEVLLWNAAPWWNGTRKITGEERQVGADALGGLIDLLPDLRVIVLVGLSAQRTRDFFDRPGLVFIDSPHPSPLVRARWPARWRAIGACWSEVRGHLDGGGDVGRDGRVPADRPASAVGPAEGRSLPAWER